MASDSDSDGSHISATPPSSPSPNPPSVGRRAILISSVKSRTKTPVSTSSTSRTLLLPKISKRESNSLPKAEPGPVHSELLNTSSILSNLPFQIKKSANQRSDRNAPDVLLLGGHCTAKYSSFFNARDKVLNFEPDNFVEVENGTSVETASSGGAPKTAVATERFVVNKLRKSIHLIGGRNSDPQTSKRAKCVSEGNFVKLNINGYGRKKFKFKNKRTGFSSFSKRRKYTRNSTGNDVRRGEDSVVLDEEGLDVEIGKGKRVNIRAEVIEEAVTRVRNEVSDENLLKLLKLTHGYDSFRDGQLEAIKLVISGKSTMLVLPTGACVTSCLHWCCRGSRL